MNKREPGPVAVVLITIIVGAVYHLIASFLLAVPVWFLWNWIVPGVFGGPEVTLAQTVGLTLLVQLLTFRPLGGAQNA